MLACEHVPQELLKTIGMYKIQCKCYFCTLRWPSPYECKNHRFGPAGDPRGAGIGTPEAIKLVWSCHREIIYDVGPVPQNWEIPPST